MPFKSKAQARLIRAKEAAGELVKGTAKKWAEKTTGPLPERKAPLRGAIKGKR